jgi:hypothetical protein
MLESCLKNNACGKLNKLMKYDVSEVTELYNAPAVGLKLIRPSEKATLPTGLQLRLI